MDVEAVDLTVVVAKYLHIADGACASIDDRLGEQVEQDEIDGHCHKHHHGHYVSHGLLHLVADLVHVLGHDARRNVAVIERQLLCACIRIKEVGVIPKLLVEVVDAHV